MPGGPFNVGSGGFPATFATIVCGPHTVSSRSQLRSDAAQSLGAVDTLRDFRPSESVDFNCLRGPTVRVSIATAIATLVDLAAMLNAYDVHLNLPHEGPTGPIGPAGPAGPIGPGGLIGPIGPTGFAAELPSLGTPDFATLVQSLLGALGSLRGRNGGTVRLPALPAPVLEPVTPGGTVNVPVILGSAQDPTGQQRPRFPDTRREQLLQLLSKLFDQFLADQAGRRAQRRAEDVIDAQLVAFRAALAARQAQLERERRPPVGTGAFGQAGTLQLRGTNGGASDPGLLERLLAAAGQLFPGQGFPSLPAAPRLPAEMQGPPGFPEQLAGLAGACPPLFRPGTSVLRVSPVPWFPVQAPNGKWFFFGHLGTPTFSKLKGRRRHHHHRRR